MEPPRFAEALLPLINENPQNAAASESKPRPEPRRRSGQRPDSEPAQPAGDLLADPAAFDAWAARWRTCLAALGADLAARRVAMHAVNPRFIPRNHRVEAI